MAKSIWQELTDANTQGEIRDEMNRKFRDSFLIFHHPHGHEQVIYYQTFDIHEGMLIFKDEHGGVLRFSSNTKFKFSNAFPERTMFNHRGMAYEFVRLPYRQFRRGICTENAQVSCPAYPQLGRLTFGTIHSALFPSFPKDCAEAIKELLSGESCGVALNPQFSIHLNPGKAKDFSCVVYYYDKAIATFDGNKFSLKNSMFRQEILDNLDLFSPFNFEVT